jgi:periplasmic protein TonB
MSTARRKPDEDIGVRKAAGARLARERMMRELPGDAVTATSALPPSAITSLSQSGMVQSEWTGDPPELVVPDANLRIFHKYQGVTRRLSVSPALLVSGTAHAVLLAAALLILPQASELPAGGETAIPVEVLLVAPDSDNAAATKAGARQASAIVVPVPEDIPTSVSITLPDVIIAPPSEPPAIVVADDPPTTVPQTAPSMAERLPPPRPEVVTEPLPAEAPPRAAVLETPETLPPTIQTPTPVVEQAEPQPPPVEPEPAPVASRPATTQSSTPTIVEPVAPSKRQAASALQQAAAAQVPRQKERENAKVEALSKQREADRQARIAERRKQLQEARRATAAAPRPPQTARTAQASRADRASATGPAETGTGQDRQTQQARQAGSASRGATASAGTAEVMSYRSKVLAHLARFKTYPESAQDAGIQGRATVSFTVTRAGGVTSAALAGSSGAGILDQTTLAMVLRAQPFPAMPAGGPSTMSFTAVIRYDLR